MSLEPAIPADWAEMVEGVLEWIRGEIAPPWVAILARRSAPQPKLPFVKLQVIVPPIAKGQGDRDARLRPPGYMVGIARVEDGQTYSITLNARTTVTFTADSSSTSNDILDGLEAAIEDVSGDEPTNVTRPRAGWLLVYPTEEPHTVETNNDALYVRIPATTRFDADVTFQIDCYGRLADVADQTPEMEHESIPVSTALRASLESEGVQEALREVGWAIISAEQMRVIPELAGSRWMDRSGFDLRLRCAVVHITPLDWFESAYVEGEAVP